MTKKFITLLLPVFLTTLLSTSSALAKDSPENKVIRLATTTSTENSGLLRYLLPEFTKETGYEVQSIAVGTGKALRMGRDGDVDIILVHALNAEKKFVSEGHGVERVPVMHNDFVIVGPKDDPAKLAGSKTASESLSKILETKSNFVSRGDDSGTHKKELGLWSSANIDIKSEGGKWYREAGQGMGKVLQMAGEMDAYTMTDRGTWLAFESKSPLKITFEGESALFNPYGIIAVNPEKYPDINNAGANALIKWMTSNIGQQMIANFKIAGKVLFTPDAASMAKAKATTH